MSGGAAWVQAWNGWSPMAPSHKCSTVEPLHKCVNLVSCCSLQDNYCSTHCVLHSMMALVCGEKVGRQLDIQLDVRWSAPTQL